MGRGLQATLVEEMACLRCGSDVLLVLSAGRWLLAEPVELEFPIVTCPSCKAGPKRPCCSRCLGAGVVGVHTPYEAVAIDERGRAHAWHRGVPRRRGEGLYPVHHCDRRT